MQASPTGLPPMSTDVSMSPLAQTWLAQSRDSVSMMDDTRVACVGRALMGFVTGYPLAMVFALMFPGGDMRPAEGESTWRWLKQSWRQSWQQGLTSGRTFAKFGGTWAATECAIEVYRGRADKWNMLLSGCATGSVLAARGGPLAIASGCAGAAAMGGLFELMTSNMSAPRPSIATLE